MTDLVIEHIDPKLKDSLEARARAHGRSLAEEVKAVLESVVSVPEEQKGLGTRMRELLPPEFRGDDLVFEFPDEPIKTPDFD